MARVVGKRENGEKKRVRNPEEYYLWRGISENAVLDFEGIS